MEGRRPPEEEIPNARVAGWFGAWFLRPIRVLIPLDVLAIFEVLRGWCFEKGSRGLASELLAPRGGGPGSAARIAD